MVLQAAYDRNCYITYLSGFANQHITPLKWCFESLLFAMSWNSRELSGLANIQTIQISCQDNRLRDVWMYWQVNSIKIWNFKQFSLICEWIKFTSINTRQNRTATSKKRFVALSITKLSRSIFLSSLILILVRCKELGTWIIAIQTFINSHPRIYFASVCKRLL